MLEFIELTEASHEPVTESNPSQKVLINPAHVPLIRAARDRHYPKAQAYLAYPTATHDANGTPVEESYDSIKETLHKAGVKVLTVEPEDSPQQVMVPRTWLEAIQPIVQAFCDSRESKPGDPAGIVCDTCPLGIGYTCLKNELPYLIRGERRA